MKTQIGAHTRTLHARLGSLPRRLRCRHKRNNALLAIEYLERRCVLSNLVALNIGAIGASAIDLPTDPNAQQTGRISQAGARDLYRFTLDTDGRLLAHVHATGFDTLLSLYDGQGHVLIQSQATSPTNLDDQVDQHLPAGTFYLGVTGNSGTGSYKLVTTFTAAAPPGQAFAEGDGAKTVTTADVNGDHIADILVPDYYTNQVLINAGSGDGTFAPAYPVATGTGPTCIRVADFNRDGKPDLAVADQLSNDVTILLGNGDGTFRNAGALATNRAPTSLVVADFNGDGALDLAVADLVDDCVQLYRGKGDGTFLQSQVVAGLPGPESIALGDFDADGRPDLAVASVKTGTVFLLRDRADGTLVLQQQLYAGPGCRAVAVGDFNGDGLPDIAATSTARDTVSVFINTGLSRFAPPATLPTGRSPYGVIAADFNGDGRIDLATSNVASNDVTVFLNSGQSAFASGISVAAGDVPLALSVADFNGDGRNDIVTTNFLGLNFSVLLNNGGGSFQTPPKTARTAHSSSVQPADVNHDGITDLVVTEMGLNEVAVLLGRGDGSFRDPIQIADGGDGPFDVAVGDLNGDGALDLAVLNYFTDDISILQGVGDGTFRLVRVMPADIGSLVIKMADLDGDGHQDVVAANTVSNDLSVYYGKGDMSFSTQMRVPAGLGVTGLAIVDLNHDGRPEIAVSDSATSQLLILEPVDKRSYQVATRLAAGTLPGLIAAADFNGDGQTDLAVVNADPANSEVLVFMGKGDTTFHDVVALPAGGFLMAIAAGDFNKDGHPDLVMADQGRSQLSLLLNNGDGTFASPVSLDSGAVPFGATAADLNGDGRLDLVSANFGSSDLTIFAGERGGTFAASRTVALSGLGESVATADFDVDGQQDTAVANADAGTVSISMGQGDGTFGEAKVIGVGGRPTGLVAGDFNADGRPDLAVTEAPEGQVLILLGLGDGSFADPIVYHVGGAPRAIATAELDGDTFPDLAVADPERDTVTILYSRGDGTFDVGVPIAVGSEPVALVAADLNHDRRRDLVTADRGSGALTILWNSANGRFRRQDVNSGSNAPSVLAVGDFNGDGWSDLAAANGDDNTIEVMIGTGGGSFARADHIEFRSSIATLLSADLDHDQNHEDDLIVSAAGSSEVTILDEWEDDEFQRSKGLQLNGEPGALTVADFNADGQLDLAAVTGTDGQVQVSLGKTGGEFFAPDSTLPLLRPAPFLITMSPAVSYLLNIDKNGHLLLRNGRPDAPGEFQSPIDESAGSDISVRDVAIFMDPNAPAAAAIDSVRPIVWVEHVANTAAGYTLVPLMLPPGGNYTRITAGDVDHDGLDDLLVLDRGSRLVFVFHQDSAGNFHAAGAPLKVGFGPTDMLLIDTNRDGLPDLVVTNGSSGDLSIFRGGPGGVFGPEMRLRAGVAAATTTESADGLIRSSPDQPAGIVGGVFSPSGFVDLVVVDRGTDHITVLKGTPGGGFADPGLATTYTTGTDPTRAVAAPLRSRGLLDLVVLNEGSQDISIFLNDGHGGFKTMPRIDAGDDPCGLAVSDVNRDGIPDLLVGDKDGDLLILIGKGDGTFQAYQRADSVVNLAAGDLTGSGHTDFVLSNEAQDQLSVQLAQGGFGFLQGRENGLRAPGPVSIADMNGDGIADLVVVNSGANNVLVYPGLGGRFDSPQEFYTGTSPRGLTVTDLNGDSLPDLVVTNTGSNDITVLLGRKRPDGWTMVPGPRLRVGARPVATTVADIYHDGTNDLFSVNQASNTVTFLRGLGRGFFNDIQTEILMTGQGPVEAFVGQFGSPTTQGLVVLNSLSNDMTYYSDVASPMRMALSIPTGGLNPVAGVMGDFNRDGYSDLVIANNGDSRITLFYGGLAGLRLADTITLAGSVHPTDLIVSGIGTNGLNLYVSGEGKNEVIPISFQAAFGGVGQGATPGGAGGGLSFGEGLGMEATAGLLATNLFLASASAFSPQSQAAASVGVQFATTVASAVASGVAMGMLSQGIQTQLFFSFRSLNWLIDNLIQRGEAQTSDILPLDKGDMAAVAVILGVSSLLDPSDTEASEASTETPSGELAISMPAEYAMAGDSEPEARLTGLDRYLFRPQPTTLALASNAAATSQAGAISEAQVGAEWVWQAHNRHVESWISPSAWDSGLRMVDAERHAGTDSANESTPEPVPTFASGLFLGEMPPPAASVEQSTIVPYARLALAAGALAAAAAVFVAGRSASVRERLEGLRSRLQASLNRHAGGSITSVSSGQARRNRSIEELPPWLRPKPVPPTPRFKSLYQTILQSRKPR